MLTFQDDFVNTNRKKSSDSVGEIGKKLGNFNILRAGLLAGTAANAVCGPLSLLQPLQNTGGNGTLAGKGLLPIQL